MKKLIAPFIALTAIALFISPVSAGDNTYSNSEFKFMLEHPKGWKLKEENSDTDIGKMISVCFAKKKCKPCDFGKKPQINLVMQDLNDKKYTTSGSTAPECDIIDKDKKRWAGKRSGFTTTRCPEKKYWRYTTTITMTRKRSKMHHRYTLTCSMRSKSKDKTKSRAEYDKELKPLCEAAIASSRMLW